MPVVDTAPAAYSDPRTFKFTFSLDAETDGLWGPVWAIAVVVLDENGDETASFEGRVADLSALKDAWVVENIVPLCLDLPTYPTARSLRDAFWAFWMEWRERAAPVADNGSTVEADLFRKCVEDDLETRQWQGPFPLFDLGTLFLACGINPRAYRQGEEASRIKLAGLEGQGYNLHNPADDAYA